MSGQHRTTASPGLRYLKPRVIFACALLGVLFAASQAAGWI